MAAGQMTGIAGFIPPTSSVGDDAMNASSPAGVTKTRHLHKAGTNFNTVVGDTPTTKECIIYVATAAGTIRNFRAVLEDTGTSSSMTFDLKKYATGGSSGSSVLSAAVSFTHSDTDNTPKAGTISSASYAAGDVFTASLTVSSSTGSVGPFAWAEFDEVAG